MRTIHVLSTIFAIVFLSSCGPSATTVVSRQRLDTDLAGKLAYEDIVATSSDRRFTPADLDQLKEAVRARVAQPVSGGVPVTLRLAVTDYGPGGSKLTVGVRVVDAKGKLLAQFDVYRTGSAVLGTVFDQRSSVINAVADGVAQYLMALPSMPPPTLDPRDYGG